MRYRAISKVDLTEFVNRLDAGWKKEEESNPRIGPWMTDSLKYEIKEEMILGKISREENY